MPVYMWRPAEILLFLLSLCLIPLRQGLLLKLELGQQLENPSDTPVSACLVLPTVLVCMQPCPFFLYLYWDLNSDPHAFIASHFTHSTVSLAPRTRIFLNYWKVSKIHDRNYYTEICLEYISLGELGIQGCCHVASFTFDGQYFYSRIWGYFIL